jgi:tRNA-specific 2-thiouridylase
MKDSTRVVVAMSGGVDSSVAAALLKKQGYDVIGMMLRLWSEPGKEAYNRCCTPNAMALARRVAAKLEIPFYAVDAQEEFHESVVNYFINGYAQGITPNPCLLCNRQIRWTYLLERAQSLGADFMATGHYARLKRDESGSIKLLRGVDNLKDQSYVLHVLNQRQLSHAVFPLGEYTKTQVRQLAREFDLPAAERTDSQDLCFLAGTDYRSFLLRYAPQVMAPGNIQTRGGKILGEHQGLAFYTIGQRKGLGIASPVPMYVIEKDLKQNILVVGAKEELGQSELYARNVNWVNGGGQTDPFRAQIKIRYKARDAWGTVFPLNNEAVHIHFDELLRDITPGQAAVFYNEDICLGGGIIQDKTLGEE